MAIRRHRSWFFAERRRLRAALRDRQALLERLELLRRAIAQRPLAEVLALVAAEAREQLGGGLAALRVEGRETVAVGFEAAAPAASGVTPIGRLARERGGPVLVEALAGDDLAPARAEFADPGVLAAIAVPVLERGRPVGSLTVGYRDPARELGTADRHSIGAFAELAGLALSLASAVAQATHQAFHDRLTGLPNRALFADRLEHAVSRASGSVAILLLDLDGFKTINDSLGHAAGDELLGAVADRLEGQVKPPDTVARLGGDEFAFLLEELEEPEDAARTAQRLLDALEPPFAVGGRQIYVGASVGIAAGPEDAETLLRNADLAMYRAKGEGKGRYAVFEPELHDAIMERLELEVDLKGGIDRDELELVYQPIFSLRSGAVVGLEALVRWRHPTRGIVSPDRFVPLAEESGLIAALGRWVLPEACRQGALWRARYPGFPGLQVGVNISAAQLREPDLAEQVATALEKAQLDPGGLTLEITETVLMEDVAAAASRLRALKELGVELAIDDFGRAYSSLTHLQSFPLDNLKIDRHFIAGLGATDDVPKLLRAIVDLAEIFGLRPIAEGIERPEQIEKLLELGCDLGQGHLLSEPLSAAEADSLLFRAGLLGAPVWREDASLPSPDAASERASRRATRRRGPGGRGAAR